MGEKKLAGRGLEKKGMFRLKVGTRLWCGGLNKQRGGLSTGSGEETIGGAEYSADRGEEWKDKWFWSKQAF